MRAFFALALATLTTAALGQTPPGIDSDGPSAPTTFLMTHQGANDAVLTWTAAVAGSSPVSYYKIYRNGVAYDKTKPTTYTDSKATNITTPGYGPQPYVPATIYCYTVSAVDTQGHEGPQQKQCTAWVYHGGVDYWTLSKNSYNGGVICSTKDTAGSPQNGAPYDIAITVTNRANWWQPFSGQPFLHDMAPTTWAMELGAFNYMTIDLKPTVAGQAGTYNVAPSQNVANTLITAQRTNIYKFALMDMTGLNRNTYYVDNIGFTTQ